MAHQIVKTKLVEGSRHVIFHIYLENNGTEGEMENVVLIDPAVDFDPEIKDKRQYAVTQIWHSLVWFDALLTFDALEKFPSWLLARDSENYIDFRYFGGIKDKSDAEHSGEVRITTNGFSDAGSRGTIIIELKKP